MKMNENEDVINSSKISMEGEEGVFDSSDFIVTEVDNAELESTPKAATRPDTLPTTTNNNNVRTKKKIMPDLDMDFTHDRFPSMTEADQERSLERLSSIDTLDAMEDIPTPDDLETPDLDDLDYGDDFTGELEWDDDDDSPHMEDYETTTTSSPTTPGGGGGVAPIPEYTAEEELENERHWRTVVIAEKKYKVDMKVIEPYKRVLSHGGYYGNGANAIVVFASCYLPDRSRHDYRYVMDNLFLYVISTLELLVADDYMIIYFHGSTPRSKMPTIGWMRRCYQMIDRRLRKNLKSLLLVHPTFWIKTVTLMTRPFISSKFYSKIKYMYSLKDLSDIVPMEYLYVPEQVQSDDVFYVKKLELKRQRDEKKHQRLRSLKKRFQQQKNLPEIPEQSGGDLNETRF